jgi:prophage regulatory protein
MYATALFHTRLASLSKKLGDVFMSSIDPICRLEFVTAHTGLSRSSIYRLMTEQRFPASVKLSTRAIGWRLSDIESWLNSRSASSVGFSMVFLTS